MGCCNNDFGIVLKSTTVLSPRSGLIENVFIQNCSTGLFMDAFSYVNFNNIDIFGHEKPNTIGVHIAHSSAYYREFCWFNNLYINGCKKESVLIESGNNLYFDMVDTNDSETGFKINAKSDVFNVFIDKLNVTRCLYGISFYAQQSAITRVKLNGFTCAPNIDSEDVISLHFTRELSYTIDDCVFTDIFGIPQHPSSFFIKADNVGFSGVTFNNLRAYNKITGTENCEQLGLLNIKKAKKIYFNNNNSNYYTYILSSKSLIDFSPVVQANVHPIIPFRAFIVNQQGGEMVLHIEFSEIPSTSIIEVHYLICI